jgi:hypothetical protein
VLCLCVCARGCACLPVRARACARKSVLLETAGPSRAGGRAKPGRGAAGLRRRARVNLCVRAGGRARACAGVCNGMRLAACARLPRVCVRAHVCAKGDAPVPALRQCAYVCVGGSAARKLQRAGIVMVRLGALTPSGQYPRSLVCGGRGLHVRKRACGGQLTPVRIYTGCRRGSAL